MPRSDRLHAALVAGALFTLYALTASHSVGLEDDGLFILASYFLGVAHPPGYPLFTLIGHLFSQLPVGSVAYRVHLASALFGALSGAAVWLCARQLGLARLPAWLAAFVLGLSPVFWSQSIVAEVYTLNTFFFLILAWLALRPAPPLPWIALLFGLSLSNHWPLMLLVAPAFAALLWPLRHEIARRAWLLAGLALLGVLPYAWMVWRSLAPLPISFYGPLGSLSEIWYFVSRAGYAAADRSEAAGALDRIQFFGFLAGQLAWQLAGLGAALAAIGCVVQWRRFGRGISAFLTIAFLMPSVGLLVLLRFEYNVLTKHVFHVYPLPSYAVAALWAGLGLAWLAERYAWRAVSAGAAAALVLGASLAAGARVNIFADHDWGARYGRTLLAMFPPHAVVLTRGEADLGVLAYYHMIENVRPDLTLYQTKGLVLGNRLFNPVFTDADSRRRIVGELIERENAPVVFTLEYFGVYARVDHWLYYQVDKTSRDAAKVTVDIPEPAALFFERHVAQANHRNAWVAYLQSQMRRGYGEALAGTLQRGRAPDQRTQRHLELLGRDFYGALGVAEGLIRHPQGYSVGEVSRFLERARELMPGDAPKDERARFFHLRGAMRAGMGDKAGAQRDFEAALSVWPARDNPAAQALEELRRP